VDDVHVSAPVPHYAQAPVATYQLVLHTDGTRKLLQVNALDGHANA